MGAVNLVIDAAMFVVDSIQGGNIQSETVASNLIAPSGYKATVYKAKMDNASTF